MRSQTIFAFVGAVVVGLGFVPAAARADLASEFAGYDVVVNEVGVSGLTSSYYYSTKPVSPTPLSLVPGVMPVLGPGHIVYPYNVGTVPSPGPYNPAEARNFDEGMLGVKVTGGNLAITVAGGVSPITGFKDSAWNTWYGQGDMFVTVQDSGGVRQFALLNMWPRTSGSPVRLDGGQYDVAQAFHVSAGAQGDPTLEGNLVRLGVDGDSLEDVIRVGGNGSYYPGYVSPPVGLDYRTFAQDGVNIGDTGLTVKAVTDTVGYGLPAGSTQTWYVETWMVPISWLSSDPVFNMALHKIPTCGNDQIGLLTQVQVPVPGAMLMGLIGIGMTGLLKRRFC